MTKKEMKVLFKQLSKVCVNHKTIELVSKPDRDVLFRALRIITDLNHNKEVK